MTSVDVFKCKCVKEKAIEYEPSFVSSAHNAYEVLCAFGMNEEAEEVLCIICLDTKGNVCGLHEVARGTLAAAPAHPREVYKRALLNNASAIILAHNHPSGNVEPSTEDYDLTLRMNDAGKLLGIRLVDHIIVGHDDYYSFAGHNAL